MKYTVECDDCDSYNEGGSAEFYSIREDKNLGFKQFRNKKSAITAYNKQRLLSKFSLAPKVRGRICRLQFQSDYYNGKSNWGFITEVAEVDVNKIKLKDLQNLVDSISQKTKLKFWDCHYWNVGYVKRNNKAKLVCIDTGSESFDPMNNAWGFENPGPKCSSCKRYKCKCYNDFWFN